jgi:hypothetical protein
MTEKAYLAVITTPLGMWENTATICTGHEAEYRAKESAKRKFMESALPSFMAKGLDYLVDAYWRAAQNNGCDCVVKELDINHQPVQ